MRKVLARRLNLREYRQLQSVKLKHFLCVVVDESKRDERLLDLIKI